MRDNYIRVRELKWRNEWEGSTKKKNLQGFEGKEKNWVVWDLLFNLRHFPGQGQCCGRMDVNRDNPRQNRHATVLLKNAARKTGSVVGSLMRGEKPSKKLWKKPLFLESKLWDYCGISDVDFQWRVRNVQRLYIPLLSLFIVLLISRLNRALSFFQESKKNEEWHCFPCCVLVALSLFILQTWTLKHCWAFIIFDRVQPANARPWLAPHIKRDNLSPKWI